MTTTNHQFMISQLRQRNLQQSLETVAVFIACLFALIILPQLLVQYVYAGQQLMEQPAIFEVMPAIAFAIGVGFFVYSVFANLRREMTARKLEKELFANTWSPANSDRDSVEALQAAMKDLETVTAKPAAKSRTKTTKTKKTRRSK